MKMRAEAFELREQLKLLRDEVAQSRLLTSGPHKKSLKFNTLKKSYWECDKASRSQKRKRITALMLLRLYFGVNFANCLIAFAIKPFADLQNRRNIDVFYLNKW